MIFGVPHNPIGRSKTMMNRRQFVIGAAAGAAMFTRIPRACAQTYELVIKGGRVIDPSMGLDAIHDVAIAGGRIVAVEPTIAASAPDTIDARGKIVAPGLIDIHTHAGRSTEGPPLALQDGVTGWVDAGTAGADTIDHVADVARGAIARHRDVVVGVKVRMSENVADTNDLEALRRAQEAAAPFHLPVMIHIGQSYSPMRAILPLLKRGDIVTHMYAPAPNGILDD